jgi:hypothetical protein
MKLSELTSSILYGDTLDDKLLSFDSIEFDRVSAFTHKAPARSGKISFSEKQDRKKKNSNGIKCFCQS